MSPRLISIMAAGQQDRGTGFWAGRLWLRSLFTELQVAVRHCASRPVGHGGSDMVFARKTD